LFRKNVLITGASSGLGEGMARELAARGHNLALCARRIDRLQALKQELATLQPDVRVLVRQLDVNDGERVIAVFEELAAELGSLDRVIVNAGIAGGQPIGTGHFAANRQIAETNFVAALAQCEAAVQIFRRQNSGHLVTISSVAAVRGMPGRTTTYAATKAALAALSEGIRADLLGTPIKVTTLYPGFIRSEMTAQRKDSLLMTSAEKGHRALVKAIEREAAEVAIPPWPWEPLGFVMRHLPLRVFAQLARQS
jgi:short-subunit dehydrogenase